MLQKQRVEGEQHMIQAQAFWHGVIKNSYQSSLLILFNLFTHCNFVCGKGAFSWFLFNFTNCFQKVIDVFVSFKIYIQKNRILLLFFLLNYTMQI